MSEKKQTKPASKEAPLYGLLAEYEKPKQLLAAAKKVRDAGFEQWDTYTPFPVHGIDPAMGIKPTILPWLVLGAGLTGATTALVLQWWTNAHDYAWIVSGKPFWSLPANIPVTFELTVLFSAITTLVGMLMLNKLPHPSSPLDFSERFARVTDDRFFVVIEARDPKFDEGDTKALLESTGAVAVEAVPEDTKTEGRMPSVLVYAIVILTCAAIVPFALSAYAREAKNRSPRIHIVPDMDNQQKFKSQRENDFFADNRAMREPVAGTVARGLLRTDEHLYEGKAGGTWARTFPPAIKADAATMQRGRTAFGINCVPCHGPTGQGNGLVNKRATELAEGTWVPPTNVTQPHLAKQPVGQLYGSIKNGIRNMPGYGHQMSSEDIWATVMYLRALQRGQNATLEDVPAAQRAGMK